MTDYYSNKPATGFQDRREQALNRREQTIIRREQALVRKEHELNDLFETAAIALNWVGSTGIILWANKAELDMVGYASAEYVGHHILEFHADREALDEFVARLERRENVSNFESRLRCADGSIKHVLINSAVIWDNGKFLYHRCLMRDITQRVLAEQALKQTNEELEMRVLLRTQELEMTNQDLRDEMVQRERALKLVRASEQRFRDIVNAAGESVWECDENWRLTYVSDRLEKVLGYDKKDVLRRPITDFMTRREAYRVGKWFSERVPEGFPFRYLECILTSKWNDHIWHQINGVPITNEDGKVIGYRGTALDITDRKMAETHIKNLSSSVLERFQEKYVREEKK
ncbi:MAG: PAS domain S-box protein [Burkholderiales bacterium]